LGATGAVSVVGTNAAIFNVTSVKLEIGSVATLYNRQSMARSLADCQRYYQQGSVQLNTYGQTGWSVDFPLLVQMRAVPTTTSNFTVQTNCSASVVNPVNPPTCIQHAGTVTAAGLFNSAGTFTASAEL
jgi:hypothetical protein